MILCAGHRHKDDLLKLGCSHTLPTYLSEFQFNHLLFSAQNWLGVSFDLSPQFSIYKGTSVEDPSSITSFLLIIYLFLPTMFAANEESSNFCSSWLRSEHLVSTDAIQQALQELPVGLVDERQSEGFLQELLSASLGTRPIFELVLSG